MRRKLGRWVPLERREVFGVMNFGAEGGSDLRLWRRAAEEGREWLVSDGASELPRKF